MLHRLARLLSVQTSALLGEPLTDTTEDDRSLAGELNQALMSRTADPGEPLDVAVLRARVASAWSS